MFQACVSISVCSFSVFINIIHRVCVYKWAYCWVKKITDLLTLFSSSPLRQYKKKWGGGAHLVPFKKGVQFLWIPEDE